VCPRNAISNKGLLISSTQGLERERKAASEEAAAAAEKLRVAADDARQRDSEIADAKKKATPLNYLPPLYLPMLQMLWLPGCQTWRGGMCAQVADADARRGPSLRNFFILWNVVVARLPNLARMCARRWRTQRRGWARTMQTDP
jgi:hypothetical protein